MGLETAVLGPDPAALSPGAAGEWHFGGESGSVLRGAALAWRWGTGALGSCNSLNMPGGADIVS